ncbi:MAG: tubulin-like doman-containing protein [Candidatus Eremiobacterota bacterium]
MSDGDITQKDTQQLKGMTPSVIIGLGGTGKRVVMQIRKKIVEEHKSLGNMPILAFLVLDTDEEIVQLAGQESKVLLSSIELQPNEVIHATITGTQELNANLHLYPHISDWLDPFVLATGDSSHGARAIRALGRLAFFLNYPAISNAFEQARHRVSVVDNRAFMEKRGIVVDPGLNVYIVGSLCGGTGSGMFLDLSFMVKHLLRNESVSERIGYLVLPGSFEGIGHHIKSNAYAALKELNYYSRGNPFPFRAEINTKAELAPPPFTYCYLVSNRNECVTFQTPEDLFCMIAHNIFLDFTSQFAQHKRSIRNNIGALTVQPDELGCPQNYMTFGLSSVYFPKERVMNACSYRLGKNIVKFWLKPTENYAPMDDFLEKFLINNRLMESQKKKIHHILPAIMVANPSANRDFNQELTRWAGEVQKSMDGIPPQSLQSKLKSYDESFSKKFFDAHPDQKEWGDYFKKMYENTQKLIETQSKVIETRVEEMVEDANMGPEFTRQFLKSFSGELDSYISTFTQERNQLEPVKQKLHDGKMKVLSSLKEHVQAPFLFSRSAVLKNDVKDFCNEAIKYYNNLLMVKSRAMAIMFCEEIKKVIDKFVKDLELFITKLEGLIDELAGGEEIFINDTTGLIVNGLLMYDKSDIDGFYDKSVGSETINYTSTQVLNEFKCRLYAIRGKEWSNSKIMDILINTCRGPFKDVRETSVVSRFFAKYTEPVKQQNAIKDIYERSSPFLNFQVPLNGYRDLPQKKQNLIGIYEGNNPTVDEFQDIQPLLIKAGKGVNLGLNVKPIPDKSEILFTREEGAFPLRRVAMMKDFRDAYEFYLKQPNQNPLHIMKNYQILTDIFPLDTVKLEQSKLVYFLASHHVLGYMSPDEENPSLIKYNFRDKSSGFMDCKILGETEQQVITTLYTEDDIRKEIHKKIKNDAVASQVAMAKKKELWMKMRDYLDYMREKGHQDWPLYTKLVKDFTVEYKLYDPSFEED